jgi:hypothetical protein
VLEPLRKAINFRRLWEGPLLALRISPKWSLGDALQNATVKRSNPSFSSAYSEQAVSHGKGCNYVGLSP